MHFTCTLTCKRCSASLRFEDERPAWKTYDYRMEESEECERSARFVSEWADKDLPDIAGTGDKWNEYEAAGYPQYIATRYKDTLDDAYLMHRSFMHVSPAFSLVLAIPAPYRYVDCPVCDAQIREP